MLLFHLQEDRRLATQVEERKKQPAKLKVVKLRQRHTALELWEPLCKDFQPGDNPSVLLLPPEYEFLDQQLGPQELNGIAAIGQQVR